MIKKLLNLSFVIAITLTSLVAQTEQSHIVISEDITIDEALDIAAKRITIKEGVRIKAKSVSLLADSITIEENSIVSTYNQNGDAGDIIVFSEFKTEVYGTLNASSLNGNGGLVEVSSKRKWFFPDWVNNINVRGATNGSFLIDPNDIVIVDGSGATVGATPVNANTINDQDITDWLENNGDLTIETTGTGGSGDITVQGAVSIAWTSSSKLTLNADRDILLNSGSSISATSGDILLNAERNINSDNATLSTTTGAISLKANESWNGVNTGTSFTDKTAIYLYNGSISTVSGAITILGNLPDNTVNRMYGVLIHSCTISSTGTGSSVGDIRITGSAISTLGGTNSIRGLGIQGPINTVNADIYLAGNGGSGTDSPSTTNDGLEIYQDGSINSTGTGVNAGKIYLFGNSGNNGNYSSGIRMFGDVNVSSVDGNIDISANSLSSGTNTMGIYIASFNGLIQATGTANISIFGTGNSSYGVYGSTTSSIIANSGTTHLYAQSTNSTLGIGASSSLVIGNGSTSGDIIIEAEDVDMSGSINGVGNLYIRNLTSTTMSLGGNSGTHSWTSGQLNKIQDGFNHIYFGNASTSDLYIGSFTLKDNATFQATKNYIQGDVTSTSNNIYFTTPTVFDEASTYDVANVYLQNSLQNNGTTGSKLAVTGNITASSSITLDISSATVYDSIVANQFINSGATLNFTGGYNESANDQLLMIEQTDNGASSVIPFTGKAQGSAITMPPFNAVINYSGYSCNDVTLNANSACLCNPTISISDTSVTEGGTMDFVITLSGVACTDVSVNYSTGDISAIGNSDYEDSTNVVTFLAGEISKTIKIPTTDDVIIESSETFNLTLSSPVFSSIGDNIGVGTILDNDYVEILVEGNGTEIVDGASSPNTTDDTDFGSNVVPSVTAHYFTITNTGTSPLTLGNLTDTVTITGTDASDFSFGITNASTPITAGDSRSLAIGFAPSSCAITGVRTATVTIYSDDLDEGVYTFDIEGTVIDNLAPNIIGNDTTLYLDASGNISVTPVEINDGSTDNCSAISYSLAQTAFTCSDLGANTISFTATDASINSSSVDVTITVFDTIAPSISCPSNQNQNGDASCQAILADYTGSVVVSDACDPSPIVTQFPVVGTSISGTQTIKLFVQDASGNIDSCSFMVTVDDVTNPTVVAKDSILYLDVNGLASILPSEINNGSTDNCSSLTFGLDQASFSCADIGPNSITLTGTDASSNFSTTTSTITVRDTVRPSLVIKDITVNLDATGSWTIIPSNVIVSSSDACGIASTTLSETNFNCSDDTGTPVDVTITVTDNNGNVSSKVAKVTVQDNLKPETFCFPSYSVDLDGSGTASIGVNIIDNSSFDNCGIATRTLDLENFDCSHIGANTITLSITDIHNNTNTCTSTVTVNDKIKPTAVCQDITVQINSLGQAIADVNLVDNGSTDNCSIATKFLSKTTFDCSEIGDHNETMTVVDGSNNFSTCPVKITVQKLSNPTANCKDITVDLDASGNVTIAPVDIDNGSSDGCGGISLSIDNSTFSCSDIGTNTVTLTATDIFGGKNTCTSTVTIQDITNPIVYGNDQDVYLDASGNATLDPLNIDNGSNDACGIANLSLSKSSFSCNEVGVNSVKFYAEDNNGNIDSTTVNITVIDTVKPTAICSDISRDLSVGGSLTIGTIDIDNGSNDACGIASLNIDKSSFYCKDVGVQQVTLTVTDNNGNVSSCVSNVTVNDVTPPVAICKSASINLDATGNVHLDHFLVNNASTDLCGIVSYTLDKEDFTCGDVGSQNVQLTVTDKGGNTNSCIANVTVNDITAPVITCKDSVYKMPASGIINLVAADHIVTSTEACGIANSIFSQPTFTCADLGLTNITLEVEDNNGNKTFCPIGITISDTTKPIALCQDVNVYLDEASGLGNIVSGDIDAGSSDLCSSISFFLSRSNFSCADVGNQAVTLTVIDAYANVNTCTSNITVLDTVRPNVITKDITLDLDPFGFISILPSDVNQASTEACGIDTMYLSSYDFDCSNVGVNSVTLYIEDVSGNIDSAVSIVTISDIVKPKALCKNIKVSLDDNGEYHLIGTELDNGSTDECGIDTLFVSKDFFDCSNLGDNNVTMTVRDVNGNSKTCITTVKIEDITPPFLTINSSLETIYVDTTCQMIVPDYRPLVTRWDNCSNTIIVNQYPAPGSSLHEGDYIIRFDAIDELGNLDSIKLPLDVVDTITPRILCPTSVVNEELDENCDFYINNYDDILTIYDNCDQNYIYEQYPEPGTYLHGTQDGEISITVTDYSGNYKTCWFETHYEPASFNDACIDELFITDLITPNGDGDNDIWYISDLTYIKGCKVIVYSSFGNKVFESSNYDNSWDGTSRGKHLPVGSYYYSIVCDGIVKYTGPITIMR